MSEMRPVFLGGTGRSGTTILRTVLAQHPDMAAIEQEFRLVVDPGGLLDLARSLTDNWSPQTADRAFESFASLAGACGAGGRVREWSSRLARRAGSTSVRYSEIDLGAAFGRDVYRNAIDDLFSALSIGTSRGSWYGSRSFRLQSRMWETHQLTDDALGRTLPAFVETLYRAVPQRASAAAWIDDTPYSLCHASDLQRFFPGALMIHLVRDPRDVVASYLKTTWGGSDPRMVARRIAALVRRWHSQRSLLRSGSHLELKMETLAQDPADALRPLCELIGIDCGRLPESALGLFKPGKANTGRWRDDLDGGDLESVMQTIGFILAEYGYEPGP